MKFLYAISIILTLSAACSPAQSVRAPREADPSGPLAAPPPPPTSEINGTGTPPVKQDAEIMTGDTLAVFVTSGGFAGINEVLTVYKDGRLEIAESRRNFRDEARVDPERLAKLKELISRPEYDGLQPAYLAQGADMFTYRIHTWTGDGRPREVLTMDTAAHPSILSQVISELKALRRLIR